MKTTFKQFSSVLLITLLCLNLVSIGFAKYKFGKDDDLTKMDVTDIKQVGEVHNGAIILCPGQSKTLKSSTRQPLMKVTATSSQPKVVSAKANLDAKGGTADYEVTVKAGDNKTGRDILVPVKIVPYFKQAKLGITTNKEVIEEIRGETRTLTVRVLAENKCKKLKDAAAAAAPKAAVGGKPATAVKPKEDESYLPRTVKICEGTSYILTLKNELTGSQKHKYRWQDEKGRPTDNPNEVLPIKNMEVIQRPNPTIARATLLTGGPETPLKLQITGIKKGGTQAILQENPKASSVIIKPFLLNLLIDVIECDPRQEDAQREMYPVPEGYKPTGFTPSTGKDPVDVINEHRGVKKKEKPKSDEEDGEWEESGFQYEDDEPLDGDVSLESRDGMSMPADGAMLEVSGPLMSMVTFTDEAKVELACPSDTQAGDMISCSVISSDIGAVNPEDIEVAAEGVTVERDDSSSLPKLTFQIPQAVTGLLLTLTDKATGKKLMQGQLPVEPKDSYQPPRADINIPDTALLDEPLVIEGPFDEPMSDTYVTVNDSGAEVLARSPRQLVVSNPALEEGPAQVEVQSGDKTATKTVTMETFGAKPPATSPPPVSGGGQPAATGQSSACSAEVEAYKTQLKANVDSGWRPPKPPSKGTWSASLRYYLHRNLTVSNITLVRSSGHGPIDESAIQRVGQIQGQFSPLPACLQDEALPIDHIFTVIYK